MALLLLDESSAPIGPIAPFGGAKASAANKKFGAASLAFDGVEQYYALPPSDAWDLAAQDFSLDAWVYITGSSYRGNGAVVLCWWGSDKLAWLFGWNSSRKLTFYYSTNGGSGAFERTSSAAIPLNTWTHIAAERSGGQCSLYVAGTREYQAADALTYYTRAPDRGAWVGCIDSSNHDGRIVESYIDNLRLTVGAGRWGGAATITVPTAEAPTNAIDDPHWSNVRLLLRGASTDMLNAHADAPCAWQIVHPRPWPLSAQCLPAPGRKRLYYGGAGTITGTVKIKGSPDYATHRRVRLYRDRDGVCVGQTWSNPVTGDYAFTDLDPAERYTALAHDHEHNFRATVADNLLPDVPDVP